MSPYPSKAQKLDYMKEKGYSDHLRSQYIVCIMLNDKEMQLIICGSKWLKTPTFLMFLKAPDDFGVHLCPPHVQKRQSRVFGPGRLGERHRLRAVFSFGPVLGGEVHPTTQSAGGIFTLKLAPRLAIRRAGSRITPHHAPPCAKARLGQNCGAVIYVTDKKWISCHIHRRQMKPRTSQRIRKTRRQLLAPTGWGTFR